MRAPWLVLILAEILGLVLGDHACHRNDTDLAGCGQRSQKILSRRRRLAFPKGSTFVMTMSLVQPIQVKLPSNWNLVFEFDVIWPILQENLRKKLPMKRRWMVKRRHRRELYATLETALDRYDLFLFLVFGARFEAEGNSFQPEFAGETVRPEDDLRGEDDVEPSWRVVRGGRHSIGIKQRRGRGGRRFLRRCLQDRDALRRCVSMSCFFLEAVAV
ncbi:hypothetical protein WN48_03807 [Eufriesea mexicana]|uniref:Uncharacterized protein n=1 Tax=Eufriesea mexicana TaxID=516756 RepID=A0A310SP02_9HYME|nr:hypothetical protein WN48_03807 [Eufriesea mexicana]